MDEVLGNIQNLAGRTFRTGSSNDAFRVVSVDAKYIFIASERTGSLRRLFRRSFEKLLAAQLSPTDLTPATLRQAGVPLSHSAYILPLFRAATQSS